MSTLNRGFNHMFLTLKKQLGTIVIFLSAVCVLLLVFSFGIQGNDFWWHARAGEWICNNKCVPTEDIFSWIGKEKELTWIAHEWLSEVIIFQIDNLTGKIGVFVISLILSILMTGLMIKKCSNDLKKNYLLGSVFFILFAVVAGLFFYMRPHVFSYFLLYAELDILYSFSNNNKSKKIYFLPLVSCIWSNIHSGSAMLSYTLCFVFLLSGLFEFKIKKLYSHRTDKKASLKLAALSAVSVLAIMINPIGVNALLYPFYNQSDSFMISSITEWQSPDIKDISQLIFYFIPVLIFLFCFIINDKKLNLIDLAVFCLFVLLFLRSSRFIVLWYIASVFCAFKYLPTFVLNIKQMGKNVITVMFILFFLYQVYECASCAIKLNNENELIKTILSESIIADIKKYSPERLFNDYNYGGELIYNGIEVYFDSRADLYKQYDIMKKGLEMMYITSEEEDYFDVKEFIDSNNIDMILISKSRPLSSFIMNDKSNYILISEDEEAALFKVEK